MIRAVKSSSENRIDREIEDYRKEEMSFDPVEMVDIGMEVNCAENLKRLCQTNAKIIQLPIEPTKCIISGEGIKTAEINKKTEFLLSLLLTEGKNMKRKSKIVCNLKSLVDGSVIQCGVDIIQDNDYRIQYTPIIRG